MLQNNIQIIFWLILGFFSFNWAETPFCGVIDRPLNFMRSASPYVITGDVVVLPTGRLTIESGVEIIIETKDICSDKEQQDENVDYFINQHDYNDSLFISFKVDGPFYINGSPQHPVIIRPRDTAQHRVSWDGIRINTAEVLTTQIQYLQISGANRAFQVKRSKFNISNSIFKRNNVGVYLSINGNIDLYNNIYTENFSSGIVIDNAAPNVFSSIFYKNDNYGIWSDKKAAAKIRFNNFWENGEYDCYRCPWQIKRITKTNHLGDSIDIENNLFIDPYFVGTKSSKLLQFKDLELKTPASKVLDAHIMDLESKARSKSQNLGIDTIDKFIPRGPSLNSPYLLSKYSPLTHAGPDGFYFFNDDGTRSDIGIYGGNRDQVQKAFPFE